MRFTRAIEGGSTSKRLRLMTVEAGSGEEGGAGLGEIVRTRVGGSAGVGTGIRSQAVVHNVPSWAFCVISLQVSLLVDV